MGVSKLAFLLSLCVLAVKTWLDCSYVLGRGIGFFLFSIDATCSRDGESTNFVSKPGDVKRSRVVAKAGC